MKSLSNQIRAVKFSKLSTDSLADYTKRAQLYQQLAVNFKSRYGIVILLKTILSAIFMCQFAYAYELAARWQWEATGRMDSDARQASSHVIFATMLGSAALFLVRGLSEAILFFLIKAWSSNIDNFQTEPTHGFSSR